MQICMNILKWKKILWYIITKCTSQQFHSVTAFPTYYFQVLYFIWLSIILYQHFFWLIYWREMSEDINGVIRSLKSKKVEWKDKNTNNYQQNSIQRKLGLNNTAPHIAQDELMCSGRVSSSCLLVASVVLLFIKKSEMHEWEFGTTFSNLSAFSWQLLYLVR